MIKEYYNVCSMNLCILLIPQFQHVVSVPFGTHYKTVFYHTQMILKLVVNIFFSQHAENFVWCKINNLPLVRLIILQPED